MKILNSKKGLSSELISKPMFIVFALILAIFLIISIVRMVSENGLFS